MINRKFKKRLKSIVKNYFTKEYNESINHLEVLEEAFGQASLKQKQKRQLKKFMMLFF